MKAVYRASIFAVLLALIACGNKGNLYLDKVELSAEHKALLDTDNVKDDTDDTKDPTIDPTIADDADKTKKKKTDGSPTIE